MLRRAKLTDVKAIEELLNAYVRPTWTEEQVEGALSGDTYDTWVYEETEKGEERICGYIIVETILGESCIESVAVHSNYRRRGIARAMIENAIKELKPDSVYLEVNEHNEGAISTYEAVGFKKVGERKKYYGEDTALIMRLGEL